LVIEISAARGAQHDHREPPPVLTPPIFTYDADWLIFAQI
jgi:hypothetical protein